ncbi:hypothetical protein [Thiosulfatihalobacter marinus]|uniref:hypothetical protein n=1 Tax=Thiosulfatihalobacter marinus TaxID=2792481 RepID=UPI0018D7A879|nr:hypothetical protein [Thiosulfatihalobacter marinus]
MSDTIFWSWQNDLPASINRQFLRNALEVAVDRVSDLLDVEDAPRINLDHDTRSTPGMADISQTIFEKITDCTVMVADVTPIAMTESGKALPNPNVMVELGFALKALGFGRIIAVLNTAGGISVEDLPFDIRHRRILTYELEEGASKAARRDVRRALIDELTAAIRTNVEGVRGERRAAVPIEGVASDPQSPGLWLAEWPLAHEDTFDEELSVRPRQLSRAWLRIIPEGYPDGFPSIASVEHLSDGVRLRAPSAGAGGGNFGVCEQGFITYWLAGRDEDGTCKARNLAAYLEETGEVWMSDGTAFEQDQGNTYISYARLLSNWAKGFESGSACLDALGASGRRRVILGIEGMKGSLWRVQQGYRPMRSRKAGILCDETRTNWTSDDRIEFLHGAWNELLDAFGHQLVDAEEFRRYREVRLRN